MSWARRPASTSKTASDRVTGGRRGSGSSGSKAAAPATLEDVPGWFFAQDQALFGWFLERQNRRSVPGDLLDMGAYLGKSAILMGRYLAGGQRLTVCDLFDDATTDVDHGEEMAAYRSTLNRQAFERNYLAFHSDLPTIVQGLTTEIPNHVAAGSCRFVHVDASHLYVHVDADLQTARMVLHDQGIVACDDIRQPHTPGVAAAVWASVVCGDLRPICLSDSKLYGTWGDPGPVQRDLEEWLGTFGSGTFETQVIAGTPVVRVARWDPPRVAVRSRTGVVSDRRAASGLSARSRAAALGKRVARELLPPVVTRALRSLRAPRAARR
jgi:hypothetical protein